MDVPVGKLEQYAGHGWTSKKGTDKSPISVPSDEEASKRKNLKRTTSLKDAMKNSFKEKKGAKSVPSEQTQVNTERRGSAAERRGSNTERRGSKKERRVSEDRVSRASHDERRASQASRDGSTSLDRIGAKDGEGSRGPAVSGFTREFHRESAARDQNLTSWEELPRARKRKTTEHEKVVSLQSIVRSKVLYARRLHRRHLAERLLLEHSVMVGTCRLFYQLLMFVLFLSALRLVSDETRKRGIHRSLESALDFEAMEAIASRERFVTFGLQNIAEKSKQFSVMSSRYFATDGAGSVELASDMELYTVPKIGPSMALPLSRFSFSAWVRSTPQFISGYLVRKRPVPVGEDAGLACWGWYLHNQLGQGFHYGAQDYFPTAPQDLNQAKARQVEIGLSEANRHPPNEYVMLTVVVTEHRVTFYHNLRPLGAARLPRNITDCFNHGEGILIGDSGLELGIVRFHPRALTPSLIEELFSAGNVLSELSTGSTPFKPRDSELQEEARALRTSVTETRDAVADRRRESELGSILDAAKDYRNAGPPHALSPPAPLGSLLADETERRCNETGRDYYSLVQGPYVLTTTMSEQDHRKVVRMPNFAGTGATLSFWYRHQKCASTSCGVYLLQVRDDDRVHPATGEPAQICWSLWLENNAIWYDNVIGTPKYQYPTDFVEDRFELDGDVTWRHLAMVFDEDTDNVRYYMDGTLAWEGPWGASVRSADQGCTGPTRRMTLGRIEPGYTYGAEVEVFDLRMFVHNPVQGPLQDDDMAKLAGAPTPFVHPTSRCHPIESDAMADTDWKDYYGHGCEWYHDNRATHSALCHYPPAREQCPNACHSLQECFRTPKEEATFVVWDRIRRIEAKGPHGTICLGSEVDLPAVLAECRRRSSQEGGIAADPEAEAWLDSYIAKPGGSGNRGRRIDMRDCDAIEASVDQHCAFDSQIVKDFTKRMSENEGNYTMAFWVKPVGPQSKMEGLDRFYPSINWYGTLSPPQHNLALGRWENPNGEVRVFSSCGRGVRDIYENFEVEAADEEEWTLIVISRVNSLGSMSGMTVTNLARNWEGSETPQCLYDPDSLFTALEFNYDVLVSPIMLLPQTLPFARVQDLYFKSVRDLKSQHGPIDSERDRLLRDRIPVVKHNYHPRSILIAPPIIFTQRLQPSTQCPYAYSTKLIAQQHLKMQETVCQHPFVCASGSVLDHEPLFCTGPPQDTARVFGLDPIRYNDQVGYADLLHTITDAPFMSRDDKVRPTSDFVTNHMSAAEITLVFYTAEFGITSVVSIQGRFDRAPAASVSVKMDHYAILEGHDLMLFFIVYALVLALLLVMVYDLLTHLAEIISRRRRSIKSKWRDLGRAAFELLIVGVMVTYVAWRLPSAANSAAVTERTVGGLTNIPWDSTDMDLKEKKNKFFSILVDLLRETSTETQYGYLCVILLVLLLGRVIYCTGAHPRLAFLTGTLTKALDDLIHAACLLGLLMCSFAGIATWRFGSYRDEFGSLSESLQTQFLMLFGEFPEHWQANREIVLYTVMTIVLQFLIVQNFLLAIIVETYMKLRVNIEEMQTEQDFFTDVVNCVQSHLYSYWYGWPTPGVLGPVIDSWTARFSVGFNDLERTELFSSGQAVGAYLRYYGGYDFLRPVPISDYAMPHTQTKTMGEEIEYRLSKVIGKVPTLKELARESMEVVNERKQHLDGTVNRNLDGSVHSRDGTVISRTPVNGNGRANSLVRPLVRPRTSSPVSEASHRQLASIDVSGMRWEGIPVDPKRMIQRQQSHPGQHGSWKIRPEHHSSLGIVPRVPHQVEPAGSSGRRSSDLSSDTPPNLGPPPVTNAHVQSSAASHEEALATATMVGIPTAPSVAHLKKAAGGQGQGQLKEEAGGRKEGSAGGPEKEREVVAEEVRRQLSGLEERLLEELRRGEQRVAEREDQQAAMFEAVIAAVQQSLGNVALTPQTHAHTTADTTPRSQPAHTRHLPATFSPTGIAVLNDLDSASRSRSRFTPDTRFERIEVDLGVFHPAGTPPISPTWVAVQEQQEATLLDVDLGGGSGEDGEGASSSSVDDNGVGFC